MGDCPGIKWNGCMVEILRGKNISMYSSVPCNCFCKYLVGLHHILPFVNYRLEDLYHNESSSSHSNNFYDGHKDIAI